MNCIWGIRHVTTHNPGKQQHLNFLEGAEAALATPINVSMFDFCRG